MSLNSRIAKLEEAYGPRYSEFTLPSGEVVRYRAPEDALDAFECAIEGKPHWLLDAALQMDHSEGFKGLPGILAALVPVGLVENEDMNLKSRLKRAEMVLAGTAVGGSARWLRHTGCGHEDVSFVVRASGCW